MNQKETKPCDGCAYSQKKRSTFRSVLMCKLYGVLAHVRCIDYRKKEVLKRDEASETNN